MKTYILRDPNRVEPQKIQFAPPPSPAAPRSASAEDPTLTATVDAICGRPATLRAAQANAPVLFIGLDVHNDSIAVSLAPSDTTEVRRYGIIGGQHDDVLRLIKKLSAAHPGVALKFCYSARERAGWLIAGRQEPFSHGPGPGHAAFRSAGSFASTARSASSSRPPRCRASRATA